MAKEIEDIRNVAVVGHGSAGKTTLVDSFLVKSGAVNSNPSVDNGTSICDFDEEEKTHKHSIESTVTHFEHNGKFVTMIDCPGYPDLIGQTIGAIRGCDTALIAIDAHSGIKVNTRRVWSEAGEAGLGRVIVLTKMDTDNIDFPGLIETIRETFGSRCVLVNVPLGQGSELRGIASALEPPTDTDGALVDVASASESLVEAIVETDLVMMEKYLNGEVPTQQELLALMARAIADGTLIPILCVSTREDQGIEQLMDFLAESALPPNLRQFNTTENGAEMTVSLDANGPVVAQVFKTRIDPFVQKLSFVRVISGTLKKDSHLPTSSSRKDLKLSQLLQVQANETSPVDSAGPGEIVAVAKMDDLHTGTTIGTVTLPSIRFPKPMVGLAVSPKSRGDETKLSGALHKIIEEDSTVHLDHDPETKEMVLTGMSELHLNLIQERLRRRDKVEVETKDPKIPYRETIQATAEGSYRHKKQSGGSGQFGEVHIRMFPFPEGTDVEEFATKSRFPHLKETHFHESSNFLWVDSVVGGSIPGNFMPAIEKGFLDRVRQGVVAGCPVQNVCVEVHFGKDHPVDSNETAFKTAASKCFAEVFQKAKPALLEPLVKLFVTVPAENVGDVSSDLSGRRGQMVGMASVGGGMTTVEAKAPLAEITTYARALSSMTGGQGSYTLEFSSYEVVPPNVQQEIISKAKSAEAEG